MSIITVDNLSKHFRRAKVKAVQDVSFRVEPGEIFGLIGPNGAGKTTIMACLLALIKPSSGQIKIDGKSPYDFEVKPLIGFLPERPCYNRWMTIHQFLTYHHMLSGRPSQEREKDIKEALEAVELEVDPKKRRVKELSRGMLQRVGLAQAVIGRPRIVFLDEPTSGMDPLGFIMIRKMLLRFKEQGITAVVNSHHLLEVEKVCDRIAFMRGGKIEHLGGMDSFAVQGQDTTLSWLPLADKNADVIKESLVSLAQKHDCTIIDASLDSAKVSSPDKEHLASFIQELVKNEFLIYESKSERRELVDLFLNKSDKAKSDKSDINE
ncbi:MAG: ABC transporter ATP-binding protein [Candidatus Melainabacteria bacterium]|nr:ABC transporter ATP-binding protein [Candidatus Melainabacteria bacterium]